MAESKTSSEILKKYREERELTLQEFADELSDGLNSRVFFQSVQQWESGKHEPRKYLMVKLALQVDGWRREMALDVLAVLDPQVHDDITSMLMGAAA